MKEKLIYSSYIINIITLFIIYIVLPVILFLGADVWRIVFSGERWYAFLLIFGILLLISAFHWLYCFFILLKNDIYSKHIIPLFLLNINYAPVYYYLVKIKKISLHNNIETQKEHKTKSDEPDYVTLTRNSVFEILILLESKTHKIQSQMNIPLSQVPAGLFCMWKEYYNPEFDGFCSSFSSEELDCLKEFDDLFNFIVNKTSPDLPQIADSEIMEALETLSKKAKEIINDLDDVNNNYLSDIRFGII